MKSQIPSSWWTLFYHILPSSITGFAYGWEVGSMGGILGMPQFLGYFNTPSDFTQGIMTAALIAGEFGGSLLVGMFLSDRFGRRMTIIASAVIYLIGQIIIVAAQNRGMFIAGRVINGLGAGPLFQNMSLYTAETTPPAIRGRLTATLNSGIAVGILVAYWVQFGALNISGNAAWRLCFALQLIPGVAVAIIIFFRPESPRWLIQHDEQDKALQVLADLNANGNKDDVVVRSQFEEIRVVVNLENSKSAPSYLAMITKKEFRRRTVLAMGLQCMQQLSGANIVLYYASKVFAQTGKTDASAALIANGISSAILTVGTVSLTIMTDFYGRRKPIVLGPLTMGICLTVVGSMLVGYGAPHFDTVTQSVQFTFHDASAGNAAVAFMFLFQFFFGALSSSIPWTYQNEVFPVIARGRGTALATASNFFTNFWLGLYIPSALNQAGWKLYFIFAGINYGCATLGYIFFPETVGRPLEELDLLFTPDRTAFVFLDKGARSRHSMLLHSLNEDPEIVALELAQRLAGEKGGKRLDIEEEEKAAIPAVTHSEKQV